MTMEALDKMPLLISAVLSALLLVAGASYSFYLHLDHWGPLGTSGDVEVRNSIYAHTRPGQTICVRTGSGALAIRWYQILPCPNAP